MSIVGSRQCSARGCRYPHSSVRKDLNRRKSTSKSGRGIKDLEALSIRRLGSEDGHGHADISCGDCEK